MSQRNNILYFCLSWTLKRSKNTYPRIPGHWDLDPRFSAIDYLATWKMKHTFCINSTHQCCFRVPQLAHMKHLTDTQKRKLCFLLGYRSVISHTKYTLFTWINQPNTAMCGQIKPIPCVEVVYFLLVKYILHKKTVRKTFVVHPCESMQTTGSTQFWCSFLLLNLCHIYIWFELHNL